MNKQEPIIFIDKIRMEKALKSKTFHIPEKLTREEIRKFIIDLGKENVKNI